ncbi:LCP family protein [Clostridiales bacterium]|nr:LCP family protein [Clostridiales bacterium]
MNKRIIIKAAVLIILAAIVLAGILLFLRNTDDSQYTESRGSMTEGFGQLKTIEWNGRTYREKPAVTTLLIAGIDQHGDPEATGSQTYRRGSPADFLLLLAIDHTGKQIHQLQIDRDTMADVFVLGVFGNEVGSRVMQICLSHYYGDTPEANAKSTIRSLQTLLDGLEIDGWYMVDYGAIPTLNDALGGVQVHMDFDMTPVNPAWTKGSTVTLHGQEAEQFVRARMTVGSGTNQERMVRQGEYMQKAIKQMNKRISSDPAFGESLLKSLETIATTNMTTKRLAEELNQAYNYEILPIDHPAGEYTIGDDGYVEFHMQKDAGIDWILEHLYSLPE